MIDPFATHDADRVDARGEEALIDLIRTALGEVAPPCPEGPGDDTAVLPDSAARPNLVTVDTVVLGRHFTPALDPFLAGAKLVRRNVSDIAAMGGRPLASVLALLLPAHTSVSWLVRFVEGIGAAAREESMTVNGGDVTTTARDLAGVMTLLGHAGRPLTRLGGRPGDAVWVTGELGGAWHGERHATFRPLVAEGAWLAARPDVRAMMDLTDGLAKDLRAMLPGGCAARLDLGAIPVAEDARRHAAVTGRPALAHALEDGEDYELVFVAGPEFDEAGAAAFRLAHPGLRLSRIGVLAEDPVHAGCLVDAAAGVPLDARGYDPFRGKGAP